jgi:pimeloyl-ACP methyl ester carboxylesterase
MFEGVEPFTLQVPQAEIDDLRQRLARTRWPEAETVPDWSQGAKLARVQALCAYWRDQYDWRRCEAQLNALGQYRTRIDGIDIHFLHVRSPEPDALPMIMTHGWPGSVIEFLKTVGPLTDPAAHGGSAADAFHLVLPSMPGYGFSGKPEGTGWTLARIAQAWISLMRRLGYRRYVAQGGDWGAMVTTEIALANPPECAAVHLNQPVAIPGDLTDATPQEQAALARYQRFRTDGSGYSAVQGTRPQTLGYGLTDSPAGQAAWIYEKFQAWADCGGEPETLFSMDEMLDNIMLYWLPGTAASSARLYWESMRGDFTQRPVDMPVGVSIFPKELIPASRRWADGLYRRIIHWNELDRGGHFAAFEQPRLFVEELRACFRTLR